MKSIVSEDGQITIPKALRDKLGIKAGDHLNFSEEDGKLILTHSVDGVDESLKSGILSRQLIDDIRGVVDSL